MQRYWVWLSLAKGLSLREKVALLERYSDAEAIYCQSVLPDGKELNKDLTEANRVIRDCDRKGIRIIPFCDSLYPARLRRIANPPMVLYCRGEMPDIEKYPAIGVVGTRRATSYGLEMTENISMQIAQGGGIIVSGGAAGVDTYALWSGLKSGKPVIAVLGCGVDVAYPTTNRRLFMEIEQNGCILSEYIPGAAPTNWSFPARNRIISGISNGILVSEAPKKSGALITARDAAAQGRDIFVIPGNINVEACAGSNQLLKDGAYPAFTGWDVLSMYAAQYPNVITDPEKIKVKKANPTTKKTAVPPKKDIDNPTDKPYIDVVAQKIVLTEQETQLLNAVTTRPEPVDAVIGRLHMPPATALRLLTNLTLQGLIVNHPGKLISRKMR